jgi:hypothetical protein
MNSESGRSMIICSQKGDQCIWPVAGRSMMERSLSMTTVGSFWGNKGLFEDIGAPHSAVPDAGTRRAPVQVIEGNDQRAVGICPWWDQTRGKTR